MEKTLIIGSCILILFLVSCSGEFVEDCIIGNTSMRNETRASHPELSDEEFKEVWVEFERAVLHGFYEQGICDKVRLRK